MKNQLTIAALSAIPLPSHAAARDLMRGTPGAVVRVVGLTSVRAAMIGVGLYVAGRRGKPLVRESIAGAVAVEAFILAWAWWNRDEVQS